MNTKKSAIACALTGLALVSHVEAVDNASLLKKLVEKGVITQAEADVLAEESNTEFNDSMPSWVNSLTLKGDLRLRYDHTKDSNSAGDGANDRWRYRFRFGATADMNNGVKVGFRLATGGENSDDDIGSTNQTFSNGFARDTISLDQAWASMDIGEVTFIGGKMQNFEKTGWKVSKVLFDGDITPEGLEAHYSTTAGSVDVGFHGGAYLIEGEKKHSNDTKNMNAMYMAQVTASSSLNATTNWDLGLGVYTVDDGGLSQAGASKRKGNSSGVGYTPVFIDGALSFKTGPGVKIYGTWVNNQEGAASKDTGFATGVKLGSAKKAGQWEASLGYRSIERDAIWDDLSDSDFGAWGANTANSYHSGTNVEGFRLQGKYMIYDNVQVALTVYDTQSEDGTDDESNNRMQADLIFKF